MWSEIYTTQTQTKIKWPFLWVILFRFRFFTNIQYDTNLNSSMCLVSVSCVVVLALHRIPFQFYKCSIFQFSIFAWNIDRDLMISINFILNLFYLYFHFSFSVLILINLTWANIGGKNFSSLPEPTFVHFTWHWQNAITSVQK